MRRLRSVAKNMVNLENQTKIINHYFCFCLFRFWLKDCFLNLIYKICLFRAAFFIHRIASKKGLGGYFLDILSYASKPTHVLNEILLNFIWQVGYWNKNSFWKLKIWGFWGFLCKMLSLRYIINLFLSKVI